LRRRAIEVGPRAAADIRRLGRYIAHFGAPRTAETYVRRLDIATGRGLDRADIYEGLRIIAFEKSAIMAVLVGDDSETVHVFYRRQDWEDALQKQYARG
jgi:plasmid stabilization system protein ParE